MKKPIKAQVAVVHIREVMHPKQSAVVHIREVTHPTQSAPPVRIKKPRSQS